MNGYGYAGEILTVDVSDAKVTRMPSADYTAAYIGGHGVAARLFWELVPLQAGALDPENCFICASGPVAGFPRFAGSRWKICSRTPLGDPESFCYCNLGERWGTFLKYAGYDALVVRGKAEKPVYLLIHNDSVELRDASSLWGMLAFDAIDSLKAEHGKNVSVLTIGPAAENLVPFATVLSDNNASGSGGLGAVMGSKNLKAIVVSGDNRPTAADPERLRRLADYVRTLRPPQTDLQAAWEIPGVSKAHACYGCGIGCSRQMYPTGDGKSYKSFCQAHGVYRGPATEYYGEENTEFLLGARLCDGYGFDTTVMAGLISLLGACYRKGLITEKETGLPLSEFGSTGFIETLSRKVALREGFGDILAQGTISAAAAIGREAEKLLPQFVSTRGSECKDYDPRLLITTGLLYATEPRRPIQQLHIVSMPVLMWRGMGVEGIEPGTALPREDFLKTVLNFWGSIEAADFSTYAGKAFAAKKIQNSICAKESLVLCDLRWPVMAAPGLPGGDPTLESQIYSAITGNELDEAGINKIGERIYNLQRAILLRQGWKGRSGDRLLDYYFEVPLKQDELFLNPTCQMPGKDGEVVSRLGAVVDREKFEDMKSEYYELRGWDVETGLPTRAKLEELDLRDVAADLEGRGLLR